MKEVAIKNGKPMGRVMFLPEHHGYLIEMAPLCFLETLADVLGLTVRHGAKKFWEAPPENTP